MPHYVVDRTARALNDDGKSVRGSKILIIGLSYKPDIDDHRESPSFELIELLGALGGTISYCDPFIPVAEPTRKHDLRMHSVPRSVEEFRKYDVLVMATAHSVFRSAELYRGVSLVVDTRNVIETANAHRRVLA